MGPLENLKLPIWLILIFYWTATERIIRTEKYYLYLNTEDEEKKKLENIFFIQLII